MHSSTIATSESTRGTVPTLSDTTAPGQPSKQPKFRATIEPPSPPSVPSKPPKSTPSQQESEQVIRQKTDLLKTPAETPAAGRKEEDSINFFAAAGRRLSKRMVSHGALVDQSMLSEKLSYFRSGVLRSSRNLEEIDKSK